MAEGAGAAGLAAMLAKPERFKGRKVGLVLCGGNIDPRDSRAPSWCASLSARIASCRSGSPFRTGRACSGSIATRIGGLGANILEVDHRRLFLDVPAKGAKLDVTVETRDAAHAEEIMAALAADGYAPLRLEAGRRDGVRRSGRRLRLHVGYLQRIVKLCLITAQKTHRRSRQHGASRT